MVLAFFLGLLGFLLLAGGVVLGLFAWRNLRAASLLGRPLSHIGKLRPGLRRVRGRVVPLDDVLHSPVTNKECVYYRLRVYEERKSWKSGSVFSGPVVAGAAFGVLGVLIHTAMEAREDEAVHSWHPLFDEAVDVPFLIEDDTGSVEVELKRADVIVKEKSRIASDMNRSPPARLREMLQEEYGIPIVDERGRFRTLHFVEEALLVGAKVTVLGTVEPVENGELCFQKRGDLFLVSERDVGKAGRSARSRAIGFASGAGGALAVALLLLFTAFVLAVRALFVH